MSNIFIGVMTGTSVDSVDSVMVIFDQGGITPVAHTEYEIPDQLRHHILNLCKPGSHSLEELYTTDVALGELYAKTVNTLLKQSHFKANEIRAIGCHGQTIRHYPNAVSDTSAPFTAQIGDPNTLVARTGITVVADFRRKDIALGGQGAPLAPAFHRAFFHSPKENRVILNIGGFSNITLLPAEGATLGFDTGPGNVLLDAFMQHHQHLPYDADGASAHRGKVHHELLQQLLAHPFYAKQPPKSTGRDEFNLPDIEWLLASYQLSEVDTMATLTELTAHTIADAILNAQPYTDSVYACGGGSHNTHLMSRLAARLPDMQCTSTDALGIAPKRVEPCLMAWLAQQTLDKHTIDLSEITGARAPTILGGIYYAG